MKLLCVLINLIHILCYFNESNQKLTKANEYLEYFYLFLGCRILRHFDMRRRFNELSGKCQCLHEHFHAILVLPDGSVYILTKNHHNSGIFGKIIFFRSSTSTFRETQPYVIVLLLYFNLD